jgi:phenylpropionate dioxygenase-like ring-hydroxylating dioxygenase large terminal subunit
MTVTAQIDEIRTALTKVKSTAADRAIAMPAAYYTSDEFARLEAEHIFRKDWICIGRADELKEAGDFYTTELVGEQLLVTKAEDGAIRVLSNVCRHRGNMVAFGSGRKSRFSCSYHAWTYDLRGQLLAAPLMTEVEGFETSNFRLPSFKTEVWEGFLFVNLDGNAEPLASRLTGLIPHIENYDVSERTHGFTEDTTWQTNWKCLAENFMEGYHLDVTHPKTLGPLTPTGLCKHVPSDGHFNAYYSYYDPKYPERGPFPPNLTDEEKRCTFMFGVFPNLVVAAAPNILIYLCLSPNSSNAVNIRWGMSALPQTDGVTDEQREFMNQVNAEDKVKLETLQQGLQSRYYDSGPLAKPDLEGTIFDMYKFMATRLGGDVALE